MSFVSRAWSGKRGKSRREKRVVRSGGSNRIAGVFLRGHYGIGMNRPYVISRERNQRSRERLSYAGFRLRADRQVCDEQGLRGLRAERETGSSRRESSSSEGTFESVKCLVPVSETMELMWGKRMQFVMVPTELYTVFNKRPMSCALGKSSTRIASPFHAVAAQSEDHRRHSS